MVTKTLDQKIDHNLPYRISSISPISELTVNEATDIVVCMQDIFTNPVDNLREADENRLNQAEKIRFTCSPDDAGFFNGMTYVTDFSEPVDASGTISVEFRASRQVGTNIILIDPAQAVPSRWLAIPVIGDSQPVSISVSVQPGLGNPPFIPADGKSLFFLTYLLEDRYGNPSGNTTVTITPSDTGVAETLRTNSDGQIRVTFGPRDTTGVIEITARSDVNASVVSHQSLEFVSTDPTDMLLTASPQVMPSHDVDAGLVSQLRAKVLDQKGNPVQNQVVTFQILNQVNDSAQISPPSLVSTTASTNQNGYAIVNFIPGTFETDWQKAHYDETAEASCDILAIWNTTSRTVALEWKNFPYLSVETEVDPETVAVNETVDVTVRLVGNGWALQPDPIDVMLCIDRSGSMLEDYPDRMVSTMNAAKIFNGEMSPARDQVGLVSFGNYGYTDIFSYYYKYWAGKDSTSYDDWSYVSSYYAGNPTNYGGYATLDLPLSYDHTVVDAAITSLVPNGGTPMRYGLYEAGKELIANSNPGAVKAVILLTDGDWNTGGDPQGGYGVTSFPETGTGSVITWIKNNNIRIYTIRLGSSGNEADLQAYAAESNGTYYHAPTGDDLAAIYTEIAGDLKTAAGVDTSMDIMFDGIEINNVSYAGDAADIVEYVYQVGDSTTIESWNFTHTIIPLTSKDQRADWNACRSLNFTVDDIGTIRLNQTWEAHFLLRVLQGGNINIFGPDSLISFDNGAGTLALPDTFITAVPNLNATGIDFMSLSLENFESPNRDTFVDTLQLTWDLNYTGQFDVTQSLWYQRVGDPTAVRFKQIVAVNPIPIPAAYATSLDCRNLNPGEYLIWITAKAPDAPDDRADIAGAIRIGNSGGAFIRIE
ncbi:MAG: hypothetical protein APR53_04560 [Methanoculleus sp. SDB]|nr:MAG: hypothetical protein APR53_04560 [Methanoculleus sp. SDB]